MRRAKITIVGAGNVGATTAHWCAAAELGDIVLLDIPQTEDMPKGKALDLMQSSPIMGFDSNIIGTTNYDDTAGSDVVVITAGIPRKPGMSRDDLLATNAKIMTAVCEQVKATSPQRDRDRRQQSARRDGAAGAAGDRLSSRSRVMRPGGRARYGPLSHVPGDGAGRERRRCLGAADGRPRRHDGADAELHAASAAFRSRSCIEPKRLERNRRSRTRNGGAEIVALLKTGSAYYAPAAATAQMVEAIVRDKKRLIPCAAYCDKEYGVGGYYVGVPVILGASGVERIIELRAHRRGTGRVPEERRRREGAGRGDGEAGVMRYA